MTSATAEWPLGLAPTPVRLARFRPVQPMAPPFPTSDPSAALAGSEPSDDRLMQLAAGSPTAFEQLVRRHQRPLLAVALRLLGDEELARDAAQRAFLELHRLVPRYRPEGKLRALLHRLVLNQARTLGRSRRRSVRLSERLELEPSPGAADPEAVVAGRQHQRALHRAIEGLETPMREVLSLRFAGGLSLQEIASTLEIPLGTVKSRLSTGVATLRRSLTGGPDV